MQPQPMAYPLYDMSSPHVPAHSQLYNLPPVGVGTPHTEHLCCYLSRLAGAHGVSVRALIALYIEPHKIAGGSPTKDIIEYSKARNWRISVMRLKRASDAIEDWIGVLTTLTLTPGLQWLTMRPWTDVIPMAGLMRSSRTWCPQCLDEWRRDGQIVYEPLLWLIQAVKLCPRHQRRLEEHCPQPGCGKVQDVLMAATRPGHCAYCQGWLGTAEPMADAQSEKIYPDDLSWLLWTANAVGDLIAAAPTLAERPPRDRIAEKIVQCVQIAANGNTVQFARNLRVREKTVRTWLRGESIPQLRHLLRLCYHIGVPLVDFLCKKVDRLDAMPLRPLPACEVQISSGGQHLSQAELESALHDVLAREGTPPPTLREVILDLGYSKTQTVKVRCPELCRAIVEKALVYRRHMQAIALQQQCEDVRQATLSLHARGEYPSFSKVRALLSKSISVRYAAVHVSWQATLRELGYQPGVEQ